MTDENDTARLEELYSYLILDSAVERRYDDLILLARLVCEAPIATITFVDDHRQWFKAVSGLDFCDSPITESICAFAIQQDDLFVIRDLKEDRRTREMAIVCGEPFVRFYAGAPIASSSGNRLGTICVMDTKPRTEGLSLTKGLCLEALARQVMVNLDLGKISAKRSI